MPDNLTKTGKPDDTRINIDQDHEVKYWSKTLDVTPETLKKAVREVGSKVADVRRNLTGSTTRAGKDL